MDETIIVNTRCAIVPGSPIQVWKDVSGAVHVVYVLDKSLPPAGQRIFFEEFSTRRAAEEKFLLKAREYGVEMSIDEEEHQAFVEIELPVLKR